MPYATTLNFFTLSTLTLEQQAARRTGVGGSDVRDYILTGRWAELFDLKTGRVEDKTDPFSLQMMIGIYLEPFHRAWFEHTTKRAIRHDRMSQATFRLSDEASFCLAHIDGYSTEADGGWTPWEGKALNGFFKWEAAIEKYMPQLQWIMFVTGRPRIIFSCLFGNQAMQHDTIPADTAYQMKLYELVAKFWRTHMVTGERPSEAGVPLVVPNAPAPPGEPIIVSMEGNNEWPLQAERWLSTRVAAGDFADATDRLKKLVPAGAGTVFGSNLKVTVNKKGAKSIEQMDDKDTKMLPTHPRLVKWADLVGAKK